MALDKSLYTEFVSTNLKADKNYEKFLINFTKNGKRYVKSLDYSNKGWDKRTRKQKAISDLSDYKGKIANPQSDLNENLKLNTFLEIHLDNQPKTTWTETKRNHYNKYIKKYLGSKKVTEIKQLHIKECIKAQEDLGISARTVKTTLELLNPLFKEAIANRLIQFNPCDGITIKRPNTKKIVNNATEELVEIKRTIYELFGNDPIFLSFYLFALIGKRKGEILNLRWENINFKRNTFLIEDTKNNEHQTNTLPSSIKQELEKFKKPKGWIYQSPRVKGKAMSNIEKQTIKIKAILPNFTLHRLRNVIVSAMAEQGVSATLMSAALGHNNTATLAKYLTLGYEAGSREASALMESLGEIIEAEIVDAKKK